jgi:ABC-type branched-subunit amino acid transport system ATPase component
MLETCDEAMIKLTRSRQSLEPVGPIVLRVNGLSKSFGAVSVLNDLSLTLKAGEVILLQGANGSGKTTLLNVLTGSLEPDSGLIEYSTNGSSLRFMFPRPWWRTDGPFDGFRPENLARMQIGRTWQDVRLFASQSLRDNIAVAAPNQPGENPFRALVSSRSSARETEIRSKVDARLASFGLAGRESSSADKISLGQSKRVAIARAVQAGARLLFLDEPLAGLDGDGVASVVELLHSLVREQGITLVIVEHVLNQRHLSSLTTAEWIMENGKVLQSPGNCSSRTMADNAVLANVTRPAWFSFLTPEGTKIIDEPLPRGGVLTRIKRRPLLPAATDPILSIRDLVVRRGYRRVVGLGDDGDTLGLSVDLYDDEIVLLQAPNGWGKSSLLDAIAGLLPTSKGDIVLNGKRLDRIAPWDRVKLGLSYLSANRPYFESLSAAENLALAKNLSSRSASDTATSSLSGGQRQRLALDALIGSKRRHHYLMLDEPFVGLDAGITRSVCQDLFAFTNKVPCLIALPLE